MSIELQNRVRALEIRITALEDRLRETEDALTRPQMSIDAPPAFLTPNQIAAQKQRKAT